MKIIKDKKKRKIVILISIPILIILQYYFFKVGVLKPMVRGVELSISKGDYVADIDQFVMKLNDKVTLSSGEYIYIPSYAKKPNIWFNVLDNTGVLKIEDGNKLIAMKEGTSAVGVMKNSRVLRKANVKVVDPKVQNIIVTTEENLKYVGDKTKITSVVEVDYNKFKKKEKATYESSDDSIIKINKDTIEAVGVGKAKLYIRAKNKEEVLEFNIKAKIDKIDVNKYLEVELGESKKISPNIITSPKGLKHPKVRYELLERKLPIERAISLNENNGTITGLKEGQEKVKVICDDKSVIVTVKVVNNALKNSKIENLYIDYEVVNGKLQISLTWDYIKGVLDYDVYLKNNSLQEKGFKVVKSISIKEGDLLSKKVKTTIEVDLIDSKIPDLSLYVVGKSKFGNTKPSNIVNIKPPQDDIVDLEVKNLSGYIDNENNLAKLSWNNINLQNVQYSIYIKNNLAQESGFVLLGSKITENIYTINLENGPVDIDVYVKANIGDKYSKHSNIVNLKRENIDEDNNGNEDNEDNNGSEDNNGNDESEGNEDINQNS